MSWCYYNEIDPYCAEWLRNLMKAGHIADGIVDERSIAEVQPEDVAGFTRCHFFAGIAGWDLALRLAGWPDDRDIWTGSCPCQPFSTAGKRKGFADERDLWPQWLRLIRERRPARIAGEQVAAASQWLARCHRDLEEVGYAVGAVQLEAACVGAPHRRKRYWFIADTGSEQHESDSFTYKRKIASELSTSDAEQQQLRQQSGRRSGTNGTDSSFAGIDGAARLASNSDGTSADALASQGASWGSISQSSRDVANAVSKRCEDIEGCPANAEFSRHGAVGGGGWWNIEPDVGRVADGISGRVVVRRAREQAGSEIQEEHWYNRVGALRAFGNAIVPQVAAEILKAWMEVSP